MVRMTVSEYAAKRGITTHAVRKAITLGHRLPGVIESNRFGNFIELYVVENKIVKGAQKKSSK